jgi:recombinational DNA repair ATPase RecF
VISGANGQGKSNVLEAIYLTTTGRSFRPMNAITEVIGDSGDFAKVELMTDSGEHLEMITALSKNRLSRKYILNTKQRSIGSIASRFRYCSLLPTL